MRIRLNGREHEASDGATVTALLESLRLAQGRVAVEVNGRIVKRDERDALCLEENDRVEVVHFVGGG